MMIFGTDGTTTEDLNPEELAAEVQRTKGELADVRTRLDRARQDYARAPGRPEVDSEDLDELEDEIAELRERRNALQERLEHLGSRDVREAAGRPRARDRVEAIVEEIRELGEGHRERLEEARRLQEAYLDVLAEISRPPAVQERLREEARVLCHLFGLETPDVEDDLLELDDDTIGELLGGFQKRIGEHFRAARPRALSRRARALQSGLAKLDRAGTSEERRDALRRIRSGLTEDGRQLVAPVLEALEDSGGAS